jgi:hypothetical protein
MSGLLRPPCWPRGDESRRSPVYKYHLGTDELDVEAEARELRTVGKVSTVRQYKKFSSTDGELFWTVGIQALKCVSTAGTGNDPIVTEILY